MSLHYMLSTPGKQHDGLKRNTMDKTLEITLNVGMNTKLTTFDDKESSQMMKEHKYPTVGRRLVGDRGQRRWLSYGHNTITDYQMIVSND